MQPAAAPSHDVIKGARRRGCRAPLIISHRNQLYTTGATVSAARPRARQHPSTRQRCLPRRSRQACRITWEVLAPGARAHDLARKSVHTPTLPSGPSRRGWPTAALRALIEERGGRAALHSEQRRGLRRGGRLCHGRLHDGERHRPRSVRHRLHVQEQGMCGRVGGADARRAGTD
eukprot:365282-Chlamydomonas_euryale.AAC.5